MEYRTEEKSFQATGLCLHELLDNVVPHYWRKIAIECQEKRLTYDELDRIASHICGYLLSRGVGVNNGEIVSVVLERSIFLIPTLFAIWKAGAIYMPVDMRFPEQRLIHMLEDSCPRLIITEDEESKKRFSRLAPGLCVILGDILQSGQEEPQNLPNHTALVESSDLAYIMYTSGSTGIPKGVEVTHAAITNFMLAMRNEPGCGEADRLLAITTICFDISLLELLLPLLSGGTTVIAQSNQVQNPKALIELIEQHKITIMQGTPTIWQMLLDSGWRVQPRLRKIFCGGELLPKTLSDRLMLFTDELWNLYGPTEATVWASAWKVVKDEAVMIGNPIPNNHFYILDDNQSEVPLGDAGELYIGGAGVARGYRNREELNRKSFVPNPFHPGRMYKTGDLARVLGPGKLIVSGRKDRQVKVRGFRIELGDIEAIMLKCEEISAAVVICADDRLIAYFVRTLQHDQDHASGKLDHFIRSSLSSQLPSYMVPSFYFELDAIPMTPSGKTDYKALPKPEIAEKQILVDKECKSTLKYALDDLKNKILSVWSDILSNNNICPTDNFFEVGGDSARLIRVQKELEKLLNRQIAVPALFEYYTIESLAGFLIDDTTEESDVTSPKDIRTENREPEGIAIVSMACRLPCNINTPEEFWQLLDQGIDGVTEVPKDRWNSAAVNSIFNSEQVQNSTHGGFVSSAQSFDISLFGITPLEAQSLDPAQYMILETCWEAFERGGYTMEHLQGSQTGVYIGTSNILSHTALNPNSIKDLKDIDGYTTTGSAGGTLSGRVSHHFGLEGPAMTIDTACSSSLVTTHLACNALLLGECDMAVSGGISLMLNPGLHAEFEQLKGMSHDGRCRSFDDDADGTSWSEGSVVTILKRLSDAQRDGDPIHGVIKGTAVNHDGRTATLTTPSGAAQKRLVRTALRRANLQPTDIDYVEAHGTATKLGDPIEATALGEVLGASRTKKELPLLIGSSKSNIGHTQAAAGLVGILKVVLSLRYNSLPKTLHLTKPTSSVDWENLNLVPVSSSRPWLPLTDRPRRAGVSAFSIGGTNAHAIVEEPPPRNIGDLHCTIVREASKLEWPLPFLLSGESKTAIQMQSRKLYSHLCNEHNNLTDVAYSLATTRNHLRKRSVVVATSRAELLEKIKAIGNGSTDFLESWNTGGKESRQNTFTHRPKLAVLFTGQGSQWPGMGRDLCDAYPIFNETVHQVANEFKTLRQPLLDVMWASPDSDLAALLESTEFAQPAIFALETSLWRLIESLGIKPDFVLGHSLGEISAGYAAGIFSLSDACHLVEARSRLMQAQAGDFEMISVTASAECVSQSLDRFGHDFEVDIAAYNTPTQTVLSGKRSSINKISQYFSKQNVQIKTLINGHAFHSKYVEGMLEEFHAVAASIQYKKPRIVVISSVSGEPAQSGQLEKPEYWVRQVREPVRFNDCMQTLARQGAGMFLELGPQPVLCGMGAACLSGASEFDLTTWLPVLKKKYAGPECILRSIVEFHLQHVIINWAAFFKPLACRRVELPTYAFQRDFRASPRGASSKHLEQQTAEYPEEDHTDFRMENHQDWQKQQFEIKWHPVGETNNAEVRSGETWGFLSSDSHIPWATSMRNVLVDMGIRLVEVDNIRASGGLDGFISLWDADIENRIGLGTEELTSQALTQLQMALDTELSRPLLWITHNAVGTGYELANKDMNVGAATLWGLMRSARSEHPHLQLRLVDLDLVSLEPTRLLQAMKLQTDWQYAIRENRLLAPRMHPISPRSIHTMAASTGSPLLRSSGAVLITGGLGHIGAHIARWLASEHQVRDLVLTSRQGKESPGAAALMNELSALGARVEIVASNIGNEDSVKSLIDIFRSSRPLRGVIHAAGVTDSGVLSALTPERCARTLSPKVRGSWLLHKATMDIKLDFFVLFSSISGIMGMPGLANYAAANTFLDALAYMRRAQGLPATSIAYGTWGGGGMATKLSDNTISHLAQFGMSPLLPAHGLSLLQEAVMSERTVTVAASLNLEKLRSYHEELGGIPPLLEMLSDSNKKVDSHTWDLEKVLSETDPKLHSRIVLDSVRDVVAKALGYVQGKDIDVTRSLNELGIDSLNSLQIRNHLTAVTGIPLPVNIASQHPTIAALSDSLLHHLECLSTPSSDTTTSSLTSITTQSSHISHFDISALCEGSLDSSILFKNTTDSTPSPPRSIFLTGVTGFVGAFVLSECLKMGMVCHCLVRARSTAMAQERIHNTLSSYGLWEPTFDTLIKPVVGDSSLHLLGLDEQIFNYLADHVDSICHCAGLVDWLKPFENYIGPNIVSTHEVLRLASRGSRPKEFHLISTISTLPKHMGLKLSEGDQEYGYGTSKYIAEKLVAAARWRGARANIYRLPFVTASSATGHFRSNNGDFLHNLISGGLAIKAFPSVDADMSRVLPVDYLSKVIIDMMNRGIDDNGRDLDFVNPNAPTCTEFFQLVGSVSSGIELMPFNDWKIRALEYGATHSTSHLARIASIFYDYNNDNAASLFKGLPVGKDTLGNTVYPAPPLDQAFVRGYIDQLKTLSEN